MYEYGWLLNTTQFQVDLGSLQDTVPTDRIVALRGGWGVLRNGFTGELLLRLTYKAYVEDEEDDTTGVESMDTDASDDELSDSDELDASYEAGEIDSSNGTDKESFMDVLAALIVSEEFQGIVASETGNNRLFDDISGTGTTISRSRAPPNAESTALDSENASGGTSSHLLMFLFSFLFRVFVFLITDDVLKTFFYCRIINNNLACSNNKYISSSCNQYGWIKFIQPLEMKKQSL